MTKQRGMTLIELMIVVAVISIVAAVAVPAYTDQVNRGRRAEGKSALLRAAQQMERYYTVNNCYPSAATACGSAATNAQALTAAGVLAFSGDNAADSWYTITVTFTPQAFTLTATPGTATRTFAEPKCGNLSLTNTGAKGETGTDTLTNCWSR